MASSSRGWSKTSPSDIVNKLLKRVDSQLPICDTLDRFPVGCDKQAQIPASGTLDDATALNFPFRQILFVEPQFSEAGNTDVLILWQLDKVWEQNTIELISHALEPGFLSNLLEATGPGAMRLRQDALQCVAGISIFSPWLASRFWKSFAL